MRTHVALSADISPAGCFISTSKSPVGVGFQISWACRKLGRMLGMAFGPSAATMHVFVLLTQPPLAAGCLFLIEVHCGVTTAAAAVSGNLVWQNTAFCCLCLVKNNSMAY
jgi:hypothetical protein